MVTWLSYAASDKSIEGRKKGKNKRGALSGALEDRKKISKVEHGGAALNQHWQVNNQTQQPNEHFDSSNI